MPISDPNIYRIIQQYALSYTCFNLTCRPKEGAIAIAQCLKRRAGSLSGPPIVAFLAVDVCEWSVCRIGGDKLASAEESSVKRNQQGSLQVDKAQHLWNTVLSSDTEWLHGSLKEESSRVSQVWRKQVMNFTSGVLSKSGRTERPKC